jgi:hypothetical protein
LAVQLRPDRRVTYPPDKSVNGGDDLSNISEKARSVLWAMCGRGDVVHRLAKFHFKP